MLRDRGGPSLVVRVFVAVLMQTLVTLVLAGWLLVMAGGDLSLFLPTP